MQFLKQIMSIGYKGFGSFHSDNVEELILIPSDKYISPEMAFPVALAVEENPELYRSSEEIVRSLFLLDREWTFLNHGAFGACPRDALSVAEQWRTRAELQPLRFYDRELLPHLVHSTRCLADLVHCAPVDLCLVPHATCALNSILRWLQKTLSPGDAVFTLDITYGSIKKLLQHICAESQTNLVVGTLPLPLGGSLEQANEKIIEVVETVMPPNTKFAVFDFISSNTAIQLPIERIRDICRARGVTMVVDGAHALAAVQQLNLSELDVDYFAGNCHKWFCAPKGCGFLYRSPKLRDVPPASSKGVDLYEIRPVVMSHGYDEGFLSAFLWDGNRDYVGELCIPVLMRFWDALGGLHTVTDSIRNRAHAAAELLCTKWETSPLAPLGMFGPMCTIALPKRIVQLAQEKESGSLPDGPPSSTSAKIIQDYLHFQHQIEVPVKAVADWLYVRISAHVYNSIRDYETLATAVLDACENGLL
eukprot:Rmarinus@m.19219